MSVSKHSGREQKDSLDDVLKDIDSPSVVGPAATSFRMKKNPSSPERDQSEMVEENILDPNSTKKN